MQGVEIKRLKEGVFGDPKTGWSAYPFMFGVGGGKVADVRGVHLVAIYPGQTRGNHLHGHTTELLFFFTGKGVFYWEESGALREHTLDSGPTVITISPGVKHAFTNTGDKTVYLLAVRDGEFDPRNPDVTPVKLV